MKLEDIQGKAITEKTILVAARIPETYKKFIDKNKVNLRKLICRSIDEFLKGGE